MKLIEPKVEIYKQENINDHIARCARICYGKETGNLSSDRFVDNLIKNKHLSMLRHATRYFLVHQNKVAYPFINILNEVLKYNKICGIDSVKLKDKSIVVVTNQQWFFEQDYYKQSALENCEVTEDYIKNILEAKDLIRITTFITTQISTSRELNRVSPNNISEQSTRYIYENGVICHPYWLKEFSICQEINGKYHIYKNGEKDDDIHNKAFNYIHQCDNAFNTYKYLINAGMQRQDARGILPLDTATKCIYTYSIKEWKNIINLRYYGTTGVPHPNAKIIAGLIREKINSLGYNL